jgi:hypothetical protein
MYIVTRFLVFLSNLYILLYVYLLERNRCECSENIMRDYIFYYSIIHVFTTITFFVFPEIFYNNRNLSIILKIFLGVLLLINIYCLYFYSKKLEDDKCLCSKGLGMEFMKIFSYFYILVIILVFIYLISNYFDYAEDMNNNINNRNNKLQEIVIIKKID